MLKIEKVVKRNFLNIQPPKLLKRYLKKQGIALNLESTNLVNTIIYLFNHAPPIINVTITKLENVMLLMLLTEIMITPTMNAGFLHQAPDLLHDVGKKKPKGP